MKKLAALLMTCVAFSALALADVSHVSLTRARHRVQHPVQRHHAHKAGRHHTPRHRHYRSV